MKNNKEKGFSLVELMVVVAIIGILAALALPRFKVFQAKARQSEAKTNLSSIYTLEQSYFGDNDKYAPMEQHGQGNCPENELGFILKPCAKSRYSYSVTATDAEFTAVADSGQPNKIMGGCSINDIWQIDQERNLQATSDSSKKCN